MTELERLREEVRAWELKHDQQRDRANESLGLAQQHARRLAVWANAFDLLLFLTEPRGDHVSQLVSQMCRDMLQADDAEIQLRSRGLQILDAALAASKRNDK